MCYEAIILVKRVFAGDSIWSLWVSKVVHAFFCCKYYYWFCKYPKRIIILQMQYLFQNIRRCSTVVVRLDDHDQAVEEAMTQLERKHSDEVWRLEEAHRENLQETRRRADEERATALEQMKIRWEGRLLRRCEQPKRQHAKDLQRVHEESWGSPKQWRSWKGNGSRTDEDKVGRWDSKNVQGNGKKICRGTTTFERRISILRSNVVVPQHI